AVAPNPKGAPLLLEMVVDAFDFAGEKLGLVFAAAVLALGFTDVENLVHAAVKGVRFEGVAQFVNDGKEDLVNFRVQRAIAAAIEVVGVGPFVMLRVLDPGRLVKLRILLKQDVLVFFPALVADEVNGGNDADVVIAAGGKNLLDI